MHTTTWFLAAALSLSLSNISKADEAAPVEKAATLPTL